MRKGQTELKSCADNHALPLGWWAERFLHSGQHCGLWGHQKGQITPGALFSLTNLILPGRPRKLSQSSLSAGAVGAVSQQNSFLFLKEIIYICIYNNSFHSLLISPLFSLPLRPFLAEAVCDWRQESETNLHAWKTAEATHDQQMQCTCRNYRFWITPWEPLFSILIINWL